MHGQCVWEFGQMRNGNTFGGTHQYGQPSAYFFGNLEGPMRHEPDLLDVGRGSAGGGACGRPHPARSSAQMPARDPRCTGRPWEGHFRRWRVRRSSCAALRRCFGDLVAVDELSFSVPAGSMFGFVGRNGSGKTTTMRIICGLLATDAGSVAFGGGPIDGRMRERIGYMPEERGLYPKMRLGDQLEYFAVLHGASHEDARAAGRLWLDRLGLGDRVDSRVEELSLGNQQRVQLAAALVHRPGLLILDEPFAGLDPIVTDMMAGVLREEARARRAGALLVAPARARRAHLSSRSRSSTMAGSSPAGRSTSCVPAARAWCASTSAARRRSGPTRSPTSRSWSAATGRAVLRLAPEADPQRILDAARRAGSVTHFAELQPALAELFRELVSP